MNDRKKMIDILGDFTVFSEMGRNYLYLGIDRIAECINGDYKERYGSIEKWIKHVMEREYNRLNKITKTMKDLEIELDERKYIHSKCFSVLYKK